FFADEHIRWEYSDEEMAGHLMHEVQHIKRHGDGGGVNKFTNELDAFSIQNRFYTRLQQRRGPKIMINDGAASSLETWQRSPEGFEDWMMQNYIGDGEFRVGELTID